MKKFISFILVLAMVFAAAPAVGVVQKAYAISEPIGNAISTSAIGLYKDCGYVVSEGALEIVNPADLPSSNYIHVGAGLTPVITLNAIKLDGFCLNLSESAIINVVGDCVITGAAVNAEMVSCINANYNVLTVSGIGGSLSLNAITDLEKTNLVRGNLLYINNLDFKGYIKNTTASGTEACFSPINYIEINNSTVTAILEGSCYISAGLFCEGTPTVIIKDSIVSLTSSNTANNGVGILAENILIDGGSFEAFGKSGALRGVDPLAVITFADNSIVSKSGINKASATTSNVTASAQYFMIAWDSVAPAAPVEPSIPTYDIDVRKAENGKMKASLDFGLEGTTIKLTAAPSDGYTVDTVKVVTNDTKKEIAVTKNNDKKYTFVLPAEDVTVYTTFKEYIEPSDCPKDETCIFNSYTDITSEEWYHDGIHYCLDKGYLVGTAENVFSPFEDITRGMVVQILYRMAGCPRVTSTTKYTDLEAGAWYVDAAKWAEKKGIVARESDVFGADEPITREEIAMLLYKYEQVMNKGGFVGRWMFLLDFPDAGEITSDASEAMHWMTMRKVILGDENRMLNPTDNASRAEAAAMIQRYAELAK